MKGKKKSIEEGRVALSDSLRKNYSEFSHLIPEFIRGEKLHNDNELWRQLTEAGIGRMFEIFLALPGAEILGQATNVLKALRQLAGVKEGINNLEIKLRLGREPKMLLRQLNDEVIGPLEAIRDNWNK